MAWRTATDLVHELIRGSAAVRPDASAVTFKSKTLSYAQLAAEVDIVGGGLLELGLQKQDRVGIYLEKRLETVIAQFGATAAGGVFVPINPLLRARQVAYILKNCGVRILVTSASRLAGLEQVLPECPELKSIVVVDNENVESKIESPVIEPWDKLRAIGKSNSAPPHRIIDSDTAAILFTSGSTGMPKGVVLSHRNLVASARSAGEHLGNTSEDRILCVLPFSFDYGLVQLTSAFNVGASIVLLDYLFPQDVAKVVAEQRITGLAGVPPLWIQLAQVEWPEAAVASLRYVTNSGGAMPQAILKRMREILRDTEIYLMYGLTEAFRSTFLPPAELDRRANSIGRAIPNAEVMVVRSDGTPCEAGEVGELVHRGVFVSRGYWRNPSATAERFRPAPQQPDSLSVPEIAVWSGDLAWRDEDGFCYFLGRRDDQIKTSGYRVSPTEVEEIIYGTGLVREAAAFGVPHPTLGQAIVVVATPPKGGSLEKSKILEACRKEMPTYMIPGAIVERSSIPRTPNGKMDRKLLVQESMNMFEGSTR
jgi:acyl-CoA ligase (AMP-forming) (exosortase A-associated)